MQGRREAHAAALHGPTEDAAARSPVADGGNAAANVTGESSGGCCQPSSLARGRQRGALARGEGAEEFTGQNGKIFESKPVVKVSCKKKGKGKKQGGSKKVR